jgi:hypothetical protein
MTIERRFLHASYVSEIGNRSLNLPRQARNKRKETSTAQTKRCFGFASGFLVQFGVSAGPAVQAEWNGKKNGCSLFLRKI